MRPSSSRSRRHVRFTVRWPVLYGTDELVAQGTLLDVSATGCRFAGTMPLESGMPLWLRLYPEERDGLISIEQASVMWANSNEFGLELTYVPPADRKWLMRFLEGTERRLAFQGVMIPSDAGLEGMPLTLAVKN
jgi:hypothetical protein